MACRNNRRWVSIIAWLVTKGVPGTNIRVGRNN